MMKRFVFAAFAFSLMFVFSQAITAQTGDKAKKSLKSLKKSLVKNSRFGNEIIYWFNPLKFSGCEVSYRYARLNENSSERFATVLVDRSSPMVRTNTVREQELSPRTNAAQQNTQSAQATNPRLNPLTGRAKVFTNNTFPYFYYGIDRRVFYLEQVVTFLDLSEIDAGSIKIETSPNGQEYIVFRSLKDKSAIEKSLFGGENETIEVESDFLPVKTKKSGDKLSIAFTDAVKACNQ